MENTYFPALSQFYTDMFYFQVNLLIHINQFFHQSLK